MKEQRTRASILRVRNRNSIHSWDGSAEAGEILEAKFSIFQVQMAAYFHQAKEMLRYPLNGNTI